VAILAGVAIALLQPTITGSARSINIANLHPLETGVYGEYQWSRAELPLFGYLAAPADTALIRLRLSAGPTPADTRPLHVVAAGWATDLVVRGGAPRTYQYLLAPVGRGLYMVGQIAPLADAGNRELGVAIYQALAVPLGAHLWLEWLVPALAVIVGGIAGLCGWRAITLLGCALVIYAREPRLFHEPRLWAEEGVVFLTYAYTHDWWQVLTVPYTSYYLLFTNLSGLLAARMVPLLLAPLITTILALAVQLLPAALILWSDSPLWEGMFWRRVLAVAALFVPISGEVWLTTTNSQFHLTLAAGILLAIPPARGKRGWLYAALLALIGLSSPSACFLVPVFWLRWGRRGTEGLADALVLSAALVLQGALALSSLSSAGMRGVGGSIPLWERLNPNYPPTIVLILAMRLVVAPILGSGWASELVQNLFAFWRSAGWMYELCAALAGMVFGAGMVLVLRFDRRAVVHYLLLGMFLLAAGSTILSLGTTRIGLLSPLQGSRYYYAPIALLFLVIASWIGTGRRKLVGVLLAIVIAQAVFAYRETLPQAYDWSLWDVEVARWQVEPEYALKIWPRAWRMQIAAPGVRSQESGVRMLNRELRTEN
jgi:hypothetical protein